MTRDPVSPAERAAAQRARNTADRAEFDTNPDRRTVTCNAADTMAEHRECVGTWWRAGPGPNTGDCQCACHDGRPPA